MKETTEINAPKTAKGRIVAYWIITGIIATELAVGAVWDIMKIPFVKEVMEHLGYPDYFLTFMGLWKAPGVIVLLIPKFPRLKEWVYAGMIFTYSGAAFSHFAMGDGVHSVDPLVFASLTLASWALRPPSRRY